jgi:50S ribosomal protein L16 3-hydroxylase
VGPHLDDYDVFLLQGMGRRRWQISTRPVAEDNVLPQTELRIMKRFVPEQEWILTPGDMLYLPPRIAHHGVALEPCLTYSIGFRAPSLRDLLSSYVDFLLDNLDPDLRYRDPELSPRENPGAIDAVALTKIKALLRRQLAGNQELIESWFGRYITEPKSSFGAQPDETPWNEQELKTHLHRGGRIERNPGSRFAYIDQGAVTALFIDGQEFALGSGIAPLAHLLCRHRVLDRERLRPLLHQPPSWTLLLDLVNEGFLVIYDD